MIKLSVSDKGFALIRDGKVVTSKSFQGSVKREVVLRNLQRGILASKDLVKHEDVLVIEVSDSYVYNWLVDNSPNQKYMDSFSATHQAINKLICRYRFVKNLNPSVDKLELERLFIPTTDFKIN